MIEEGITDATGRFRVRGLLPTLEYSVVVRSGEARNALADETVYIERTSPASLTVHPLNGDVSGVNMTAFVAESKTFVSVDALFSSSELARSAKLHIFAGNVSDLRSSAKRVKVLDVPLSQHLEVPLSRNSRVYSFRLATDLNPKDWEIEADEVCVDISATAQEAAPSVSLQLHAFPREASLNTSRSSFWVLVVIVAGISLLAYWRDVKSMMTSQEKKSEGPAGGKGGFEAEQYIKHFDSQKKGKAKRK